MFDILSMHYLPSESLSFLIRVIYLLEQLLAGTIYDLDAEDPSKKQNAKVVLDILTGWMPLNAGRGSITFIVFGVGRLSIEVDGSNLTIEVEHEHPEAPHHTQQIALKTIQGSLPDWTEEGMQSAEAILTLASHESEYCQILWYSDWEWTTDLRPSPEWVALRAEARAMGAQPPRAIHWLANDPQDITGA